MNDGMNENFWNLCAKELRTMSSLPNLHCDASGDAHNRFITLFDTLYDGFAAAYMVNPDKDLDRHKAAALFIVAVLNADLIQVDEKLLNDKKGNVSISVAKQKLALNLGLSYMLASLNDLLSRKGITRKLRDYAIPEPFCGGKSYYELYVSELYVLEPNDIKSVYYMSNELYLFEYITLLRNGIDPALLKEN